MGVCVEDERCTFTFTTQSTHPPHIHSGVYTLEMPCQLPLEPCEHCLTLFTRINRWLIQMSHVLQPKQVARIKLRDEHIVIEHAFLDLARHMGFDTVLKERVVELRLTDNMVVHPATIEDAFVAHLLNRACVCVSE